jgi:hypothetical protein
MVVLGGSNASRRASSFGFFTDVVVGVAGVTTVVTGTVPEVVVPALRVAFVSAFATRASALVVVFAALVSALIVAFAVFAAAFEEVFAACTSAFGVLAGLPVVFTVGDVGFTLGVAVAVLFA